MTGLGWMALETESGRMHVVPIDDDYGHSTTCTCWCSPTDDDGILVHHSADKREEYERGRKTS
jgi:hypothetical protein